MDTVKTYYLTVKEIKKYRIEAESIEGAARLWWDGNASLTDDEDAEIDECLMHDAEAVLPLAYLTAEFAEALNAITEDEE